MDFTRTPGQFDLVYNVLSRSMIPFLYTLETAGAAA